MNEDRSVRVKCKNHSLTPQTGKGFNPFTRSTVKIKHVRSHLNVKVLSMLSRLKPAYENFVRSTSNSKDLSKELNTKRWLSDETMIGNQILIGQEKQSLMVSHISATVDSSMEGYLNDKVKQYAKSTEGCVPEYRAIDFQQEGSVG
jgi:hypothetical protein